MSVTVHAVHTVMTKVTDVRESAKIHTPNDCARDSRCDRIDGLGAMPSRRHRSLVESVGVDL
jgi:hypothetical protein